MKEYLKFVYIFLSCMQVKARKCHNLGFCPSTVIKAVVSSRSLCFLFPWLERKTVKEGDTELLTGGEVVVLNDCKQ